MANPLNIAIPLKLDAFVLNEKLCEKDEKHPEVDQAKEAKIAPITQPNYTFLQLDEQLLQHDILDHVDLHNAFPAKSNPRVYDLGKDKVRDKRMGVYLHWVMPRFYRTGSAATPTGAPQQQKEHRAKGLSTSSTGDQTGGDYSSPEFRALPNRWLVIRKLDPKAATTDPPNTSIKEVEAWVIESDRVQKIDDFNIEQDLQVDVSPYITTNKKRVGNINLAEQAETFIGYKKPAQSWNERDINLKADDNEEQIKRVDLTAVSSSNQLFLDYQPHCSNVFSMIDTFEYTEGKTTKYLQKAQASYYVLGWHSDKTKAPFGDLTTNGTVSRGDRLRALSMKLKGKDWPDEITNWLQSKAPAFSVCHGAMYNVIWDRNERPAIIPANEASQHLLDTMPITVGTTPIDSLLAYVNSHQQGATELEKDLQLLEPLLRAQDEGVDVHRVAVDEVQNWNFARESGGSHWHIQSQEGEKAKIPSRGEREALEKLNNAQRLLDSTKRQILQLQWDMFSYWWKLVSGDVKPRDIQGKIADLTDKVDTLRCVAQRHQIYINKKVKDRKTLPQCPQEGVLPEFSQSRDPTLLVSGVQGGWPDDYLDDLEVRLTNQLLSNSKKIEEDEEEDMIKQYGIDKLPPELFDTAKRLIGEFNQLGDENAVFEKGQYPPLYHDRGAHGEQTDPLRDQWATTQPWAPLFLEWQAEYFHIPWEDWTLALTGELQDQIDKRWRLAIDPEVDLLNPQIQDKRVLSGRILLLPQPSFSLQTTITQLFNTFSPDEIKKYLPGKTKDDILKNTWKLPFVSASLDGFTDHLLTTVRGTHIKPNARYPKGAGYDLEGIKPIAEAIKHPFKSEHLAIIDIHSDTTPYGALLSNSAAVLNDTGPPVTKAPFPFKPVTHGQFRFSKLNIVDKFGQAINAIDARYGHEDDEAVYPHLSSYYGPQTYQGKPNLVRDNATDQKGHVEFAQVPPGINQPARLNSTFVKYDKRWKQHPSDYSYWRPVTEWENPIWGWVVLNYVDYGIQLFLQDGTFYREPFKPPPLEKITATQQLDHLVKLLSERNDYLHAFLAMANESLQESPSSAPSAYSEFLNSLVGRPLALVNAGWSLELSIHEKVNQAATDSFTETQPFHLLPGRWKNYEFPIKLGDKDRSGDGLVGYFHLNKEPTPGNELDLTKIYTYYTRDDKSGILKDIADVERNKPPKLSCFWNEPEKDNAKTDIELEKQAAKYAYQWNQKLQVVGAIVDPFLPITAFSSILPMNKLQLPSWTWQQAMNRMTAFFHLGPTIVTEDVQKYNIPGNKTLDSDYNLRDHDPTIKDSAVGMPALQTGDWAWLQPFSNPSTGGGAQEGNTPKYMSLGLGKVDSAPKYESGPYTALEGYLQLKQPIVRPDDE
ncbi:hypothetical protein EYZ11_010273 [Aspergillus tanneri]|uniref:Uncharacterized protein n=1 Tax=Aspergillus tanneri TaxID=1220188 RepID=A0A4S3J627_9EURO|nr:hypothetical protein EYZ11_010273 [Aspergillus tanneri]